MEIIRTTIRHYSTVYKLVHGTSLEHYLHILKEHPFHADHDATFFFWQNGNEEHDYHRFFRIYRHGKKGIFCIEKGAYIVTKNEKTDYETWSVDEHYESDSLAKIGEDLFHYFKLQGV